MAKYAKGATTRNTGARVPKKATVGKSGSTKRKVTSTAASHRRTP